MVRRRTLALERRIRELAVNEAASKRKGAVLFAERGQPRWPDRVMNDPTLEPVDRMVWMVLRQSAVRGRFPSYAQIGRAANVASKSTVSRAITILRATRWLARYAHGSTGGATQDEPRWPVHVADSGLIRDAGAPEVHPTAPETHPTAPGAAIEAYVLVDAPLPVADVLYLDGSYLRFLQFSQVNPHARVRSVARDMLASLEDATD